MTPSDAPKKYKVLFVCLGNICRSPTAHGIMEQLVAERNMQDRIEIDSAGTYGGHAGNLPDQRMRSHAARRGLKLTHRSRPVVPADFEDFDLILAMDDRNYDDLRRMAPDLVSEAKIRRMVDFGHDLGYDYVPDPYYSGAEGFELVLDLLQNACADLADQLEQSTL